MVMEADIAAGPKSRARRLCAEEATKRLSSPSRISPALRKRRFLIGGRDRQNRPGSGFAPSVESIEGLRGLIAEVPEESINLTHVGSISEPGFRTRGARREFGGPRLETAVFIINERRARRRAVGDDARPLGPRPAQQETQYWPPRL